MKKIDVERVKKDLETIERYARFRIIIDPSNNAFQILENPRARLDVIAVVGVHDGLGELAVLAEVGFWRTRPYHEAAGRRKRRNQKCIPERKKQVVLTREQYALVAPTLFLLIHDLARAVSAKWHSPTYTIRMQITYLPGKRIKSLKTREKEIDIRRGVKFSFSKKDVLLTRDVFWAEIRGNSQRQAQMLGLSRFVKLALHSYIGSFDFRGRKKFADLKGAQAVAGAAEKWPLYLRVVALEKIYGPVKDWFHHHLVELLGLGRFGQIKQLAELQMVRDAEAFGKPQDRLGGIQLIITTGLDAGKDYVVAEVFPRESDES